MQVKVDQGFLNNIIELFSTGQEESREQEVKYTLDTHHHQFSMLLLLNKILIKMRCVQTEKQIWCVV